jgi:hypothetical protein
MRTDLFENTSSARNLNDKPIVGEESYEDFSEDIILSMTGDNQSQNKLKLHSETGYKNEQINLPGIFAKPVSPQKSDFTSLQKWEGVVVNVHDNSFEARLIDLTANTPEETAEIPLEEVSEDDFSLIEEGAVFYWNIGYRKMISGQRERVTFIRFRRLPLWQKGEVDAARQKADKLQELFGWK